MHKDLVKSCAVVYWSLPPDTSHKSNNSDLIAILQRTYTYNSSRACCQNYFIFWTWFLRNETKYSWTFLLCALSKQEWARGAMLPELIDRWLVNFFHNLISRSSSLCLILLKNFMTIYIIKLFSTFGLFQSCLILDTGINPGSQQQTKIWPYFTAKHQRIYYLFRLVKKDSEKMQGWSGILPNQQLFCVCVLSLNVVAITCWAMRGLDIKFALKIGKPHSIHLLPLWSSP